MNDAPGTFSPSRLTMSVESFTLVFRALRLVGLWSSTSDGWGYVFYTSLVVLISPYLIVSVVLKMAPTVTGVDDWAFLISFVLGYAAFCFKSLFFVLFRVRIGTLVDDLCTESSSSTTRAKKIFLFFQILLNITLVAFCALPMLKKFLLKEARGKSDFPLDLWFPFDTSHNLVHVLTYLWQVVIVVYESHTAINIDVFFLTVFNEIESQMDNLNCLLACLKPSKTDTKETLIRDEKDNQKLSQIEIQCHSQDAKGDDLMFKELVRCIIHHQRLIRVVDDLETVMSYCMFPQVFFNIVNITLYVFLLSTSHHSSGHSFLMVACLLIYLLQNGFYCWFGDSLIRQMVFSCMHVSGEKLAKISHKSEKLIFSVYSCDWTSSSPRCKCAILLLMSGANRPLQVKIGKLYRLSRETFLQMMNSSYGLFNVLYNIEGSTQGN